DQRVVHAFGRRVSAHPAGVWAFVAVVRALVVAGRRKGDNLRAVGDRKQRELRPLEAFFDDDLLAAPAEALLDEQPVDRPVRLFDVLADDHALAASQAIRLHGHAAFALARPGLCRPRRGEALEFGGGDTRAPHQLLGERLARLDAARAAVGAEDIESRMPELFADAGVDRRLWAEHHQAEPLAFGEVDETHHVGGADGDVARHATGAAVARRAVHALDEVRLDALPDERVLARPGTDDEDLHPRVSGAASATPTRSCRAASM